MCIILLLDVELIKKPLLNVESFISGKSSEFCYSCNEKNYLYLNSTSMNDKATRVAV